MFDDINFGNYFVHDKPKGNLNFSVILTTVTYALHEISMGFPIVVSIYFKVLTTNLTRKSLNSDFLVGNGCLTSRCSSNVSPVSDFC